MSRGRKKKEKVIYYDDGSTVADMSGIGTAKQSQHNSPRNSFKTKMSTFFGAVRLMLVPLVTVVCALGMIYAIIYLLFSLAS